MVAEQKFYNLRILIVSQDRLCPEFGAAQMAINLASGLRLWGAEVTLWEIPIKKTPSWWFAPLSSWKTELDRYVAQEGPFDIIDAPAQAFTKKLSKQAFCVARSVQPHLSYLWMNLKKHKFSRVRDLFWFVRSLFTTPHQVYHQIVGWLYADLILCLGTTERNWIVSKFPMWKNKTFHYLNAIAEEDQLRLKKVRENRISVIPSKGLRFLWIGRLASHKGPELLFQFIKKRLKLNTSDTFTVAGCGENYVRDIPEKLRVNKRFKVIPRYSRSELPAILASHDVGLFTSTAEGWGLSLNEMLESGMIVYATEAGGVRDIKSVSKTMLKRFPPDEKQLFRNEDFLCDWDMYYGQFSWKLITEKYLRLMTEQLNLKKDLSS